MKNRKILLFYFLLFLVIYSCKKDNHDSVNSNQRASSSSNNQLITAHYWRVLYERGVEVYPPDSFSFYQQPDSCQADNRLTFYQNGFAIRDPYLNNSCNEFIDTADWSLLNNQTEIKINNLKFTILQLTSASFKIGGIDIDTVAHYTLLDTVQFIYP